MPLDSISHKPPVHSASHDLLAYKTKLRCQSKGRSQALMAAALLDHIKRSLPVEHNPCGIAGSGITRRTNPGSGRSDGNRQIARDGECSRRRGDEEYVLDRAPPPLTLAQRMGLVAGPSRRLTEEDWTEVKARSIQEGDSTQPCVICREEFRLQPQVLLSCSHVFHKACLKSFERFSGRKSCPMCRREQYETRVIHDGARLYREKCAIRIQAVWRGYLAHKWYRSIRERVAPKDQRLRQKFFQQKFQEMNDSFLRSCSTDLESLFSEIEQSIATSHTVLRRFGQYVGTSAMEDEDWLQAQEKAIQRDSPDCPICLNHLYSNTGPSQDGRSIVLLSCSHLYHQPCLQAFERFCQEVKPTCPLCRSGYLKRVV